MSNTAVISDVLDHSQIDAKRCTDYFYLTSFVYVRIFIYCVMSLASTSV